MDIDAIVGPILARRAPPQGMTSTVTLLESARGRFALKQADRAPYVDWLMREAAVLQALAATDLPAPRCLAFEAQPGLATLLMTALPGEPLSACLCCGVTDATRRDLLTQFGRLLAHIHATPVPATLCASQPWLARILEEAQRNLARGYAEPGAPPVTELMATRPLAQPDALIHGDYTLDNVLVSEGRICGVIDWGRGDCGDRRYDLTLATRPQTEENAFLDAADVEAFYIGYQGERLTEDGRNWFSQLYEYF
jgi:aminoglycoside phosphotransferase